MNLEGIELFAGNPVHDAAAGIIPLLSGILKYRELRSGKRKLFIGCRGFLHAEKIGQRRIISRKFRFAGL